MKTIKYFFSGLLVFVLYKIGLTVNTFDSVYDQRSLACDNCELRSGKFCSKRKSIKILNNKFLLKQNPSGIITGCGCFLPFKKSTNSKCPMDKWIEF